MQVIKHIFYLSGTVYYGDICFTVKHEILAWRKFPQLTKKIRKRFLPR